MVRILLLAAVLLSGCATSTAPGAVGVSRPQLLIVPSAAINAQAAEGYAKMSSQAGSQGRLNPDPAMTARVRGIANRLIQHVSTFRPEAQSWQWEVNVIQSNELNAFCAPGGKIAVYTGLIQRLSLTDEELAAVMGHEIAHALREHSREKVSQSRLSNAIVQAIAQSGSRNAGATSALTDIGSKLFLHLPFSREMELEADVMGIELMARAGLDPRQAPNVWRKMQAQGAGAGSDFLSTHPNSDKRIAALEAAVPLVLPLYASAQGAATLKQDAAAKPSAVEAARPAAQLATGSTARVVAAPSPQLGQESFQVRKLAETWNCGDGRLALTRKEPGLEAYSVACTDGSSHQIECTIGACAKLK